MCISLDLTLKFKNTKDRLINNTFLLAQTCSFFLLYIKVEEHFWAKKKNFCDKDRLGGWRQYGSM